MTLVYCYDAVLTLHYKHLLPNKMYSQTSLSSFFFFAADIQLFRQTSLMLLSYSSRSRDVIVIRQLYLEMACFLFVFIQQIKEKNITADLNTRYQYNRKVSNTYINYFIATKLSSKIYIYKTRSYIKRSYAIAKKKRTLDKQATYTICFHFVHYFVVSFSVQRYTNTQVQGSFHTQSLIQNYLIHKTTLRL